MYKEVGWLTWCAYVNRYGVRYSVETVNIVDHKSDPCNLDPWPGEFKNIRGRVLTKTNQHVKYESSVINSSQDNEQKHVYIFFTNVTLTLCPSELKIIRGHALTKTYQHVKYESLVLKIRNGNYAYIIFYKSDHCVLDIWPKEPKINRGLVLT